jgi:mannitol/fructose-specific phosphotransferase system IIA component (Ntr-type)
MRLTQFLNENLIDLDFDIGRDPEVEERLEGERLVAHYREVIIGAVTHLLDRSGKIGNASKLFNDLLNREKKAATAIGLSIAIPHVRTIQAKSTIMGFLRAKEPIPFGAPDDKDVQIFIPIVGPPYDDKVYLKIYRQLGELLLEEGVADQLINVAEPGEVIRIFGAMT